MASKDVEIAKLRAELAAANEATRAAEEDALAAKEALLPMSLEPYLAACHTLSRAIVVVTDRSLTTQGDVTDPVGRIYPRRIVPWDNFPARQGETWRLLLSAESATGGTDAATSSFASRRAFLSQNQIDYVLSVNSPISSEHGLRYFERDTVEIPVRKLMATAFDDAVLRRRFGLRGAVDFESHTNLGDEKAVGDVADGTADPKLVHRLHRVAIGRGRGTMADQFCIYRRADGADIPVTAIEYKAPHKLTADEITTGLAAAIEPDRDIINRDAADGESAFVFASKSLAAAAVTQLFSYMVGKGIQYGYICTGQVFVFLFIPDDPTTVFYHVCVPNVDVDDDVDDDDSSIRLQRTAVAQVFAFTLQALGAVPPTAAWFSAAAKLGTWAVEYDDILRRIPPSVRKTKENASPYKPSRWRGSSRDSPVKTRSSRNKPGHAGPSQRRKNDSDDSDNDNRDSNDSSHSYGSNDGNDSDKDGGGGGGGGGGNNNGNEGGGRSGKSSAHRPGGTPPSPSPSGRASKRRAAEDNTANNGPGAKKRQQVHLAAQTRTPIQEQPYCTQRCLLGLVSGGPVDAACPNAATHGPQHQIDATTCMRLLAKQIALDRDRDADFAPMFMSGLIGALYKVRLTAYGYTLVGKAVETANRPFLQMEKNVYGRLQPMQGEQIPVCLGLADLALPLYGYGGVFHHILLLSWAGRSLARYAADDAAYSGLSCATAVPAVEAAFRQMHELGVLHGDAEPRNILYDAGTKTLMVVDFERSELHTPSVPMPLASVHPNGRRRKTAKKRRTKTETAAPTTANQERATLGRFTRELRCIADSCARCLTYS
ncbi:hypothetical protein SPBR_02385 [Sporothrix brasiliensis 5110]|uniref:Protein kinase domain-containing protein n=1 Tax=Sporothrix brasiliensis 5110 TaxID=1398154 RepID=A0A0C2FMA2_9PEZI|nr:uncharacterized protein SPBR_02385 [Sporothrix brasiliensis 5110]KIH92173.1 hypothetical protein SPBR_02385 [Sporothrix brasiliensis 5110]